MSGKMRTKLKKSICGSEKISWQQGKIFPFFGFHLIYQ